MENSEDPQRSLNSSQKLHLLTSCQYADQLLAEAETILAASSSKSPFNKYKVGLSPVQIKVVQDYIARIRAQMVQVLKSQEISIPPPQFEARKSIRVNLEFADIAFDECRPDAMRGYGAVPEPLIPELNGLVQEVKSVLRKLSTYLAQDIGQDLEARLQRLEHTGDEIELLKMLERIINERGLVEFRSTLSVILDRLESNSFQIAVFGRVSSGKSSLLNYILETDVLPVGVNPITAVPTRIVHGTEPKLTVAYVDRKWERTELARLPEFVSEQFNPGNTKHVTRIVAELPSRRLQDGVVFVDTPGLGSLATAGAAETLAYLPQCDLGVVLVNAGSALSQEDLSTLQSLYEAAIPALALLSKADLLGPEDRERSANYIAAQVSSQLGVRLSVHPVSARGEHAKLLDDWFLREIQPLCERHQELAQQSLRRKIGTLREAVEAALKIRLELAEGIPKGERAHLRRADTELRRATGKFEEVNAFGLKAADELRDLGELAMARTASEIADRWFSKDGHGADAKSLLLRNLSETAAEGANQIFSRLQGLARELAGALANAADTLEAGDGPPEEELISVVKEMPRPDPRPLEVVVERDILALFGRRFNRRRIERKLHEHVGDAVNETFQSYGRIVESWIRRTLAELQRQFDAHADGYRAQLERLAGAGRAGPEETQAVRQDIDALGRAGEHVAVEGSKPV
jgi:GTP-binding protein EngB required for normal cell division